MHEVSMARAVVRTVMDALPDPATRVTQVRLRIGALSGITPEGLRSAYEVVTADTALAGASLAVEEAPLVVRCSQCGEQELAGVRDLACPVCGQPCGEVVGGREVEVVEVLLEQ